MNPVLERLGQLVADVERRVAELESARMRQEGTGGIDPARMRTSPVATSTQS